MTTNRSKTYKSTNPNYRVIITSPTYNLNVIGDMAESTSIAVASAYQAFSQGTFSAGGLSNFIGGQIQVQGLTKQVWQGTQHLRFQIPLLFDAQTNAKDDVHDIAVRLLELCLPDSYGDVAGYVNQIGGGGLLGTAKGQILTPPNSPWFGSERNKISVRLGRLFFFESVVLESATYVADSKFTIDGMPIAGHVDLSFSTDYVLSRSDLRKAASAGYSGGNQ